MKLSDVKVGDKFYHRTLKQVGEFTDICEWGMKHASHDEIYLEFTDPSDGDKEMKFVTFSLCDKVENDR